MGFEDQWRTRFEEFAGLRDDEAGIAGWTETGLDARIRRFIGLWAPGPAGQRWLDAGCGAGSYTRLLLGSGHEVIGADYSLPTLRKAVARDLPGAAFVVADVRRLPFPAKQFDGALCFGVTQALADSEPAVRELARLVRSGGRLWIDALNGCCVVHVVANLWRKACRRPPHLRYESPGRLKRLFRECGFADVRLDWMPIVPTHRQGWQRMVESAAMVWIFRHVPLVGLLASHAFIVHARKSG